MTAGFLFTWLGLAAAFYGGSRYILAPQALGPRGRNSWSTLILVALVVYLVGAVLDGSRSEEGVGAADVIIWTGVWWNGGGGDGTRKRLRQAADHLSRFGRRSPVPA